MERFATSLNVVKQSYLEYPLDYFSLTINESDIVIFGRYKNHLIHELVILVGVEIKDKFLPKIQEYAVRNIDEDTQGIYLGRIKDVIEDYTCNPGPYAGGAKAVSTNFSIQTELMKKVYSFLRNRKAV